MTADRAKPRDAAASELDLLAEYAAGLLDGTPEGTELAVRIEREPELAELHAALVHADGLVRAELAAISAPPAMPEDLAARLDAVLAAEPALTEAARSPRTERASTDQPNTDQPNTERPSTERAGTSRPPTRASAARGASPLRRRRWLADAGKVAAGIAVLAGAAFGVNSLTLPGSVESGSAQSGARDDRAADSAGNLDSSALGDVRHTGTDYRESSLPTQVSSLLLQRKPSQPESSQRSEYGLSAGDRSAEVGQYMSLSREDVLARCLTALGLLPENLTLDYASFDGRPALVVVERGTTSATVHIVGPQCGQPDADRLLRTTVPL